MAARDVIKNQNLYADGRGYAGQLQEFTPPVLELLIEKVRLGGMDAPVPLTMGMEAMDAGFVLISYDRFILASWGIREGAFLPFTVKEVLESFDGTITQVVHTMRGKIVKLDSGTHKPGEVAPLKVELGLSYYKQTHGGVTLHEIDPENMVRIIDGVDVLAAQRRALT